MNKLWRIYCNTEAPYSRYWSESAVFTSLFPGIAMLLPGVIK